LSYFSVAVCEAAPFAKCAARFRYG